MCAPAWSWPDWFRAWQRSFSSAEPLVAYGARTGDRLAGLGIFRRRGGRLQAAANVHSPWFSLLAESTDARQAVIGAMLDDRPRTIELPHVIGGSEDEDAFIAAAGARHYRVLRTHAEQVPYVRVGGDWEAYAHDHPGRKHLKELRRCRRRLSELGSLSFEWHCPEPSRVDGLLAEGLRVEGSGWKDRSGSAILMIPSLASFYAEAARWAADRGWLRFGFLRLDGRPIAFDYALEKDGVISLLKGGYDEAFASSGPGILLLHDEVAHAFAADAHEIDLLGRCEPHKLRWADALRTRVTLTAFAPTLSGRLAYAGRWFELCARRAAHRSLPASVRQPAHRRATLERVD